MSVEDNTRPLLPSLSYQSGRSREILYFVQGKYIFVLHFALLDLEKIQVKNPIG